MKRALVLSTLALMVSLEAAADSWAGPQTREVFSESREYFVRVTPGESLGEVVGFAGSKKGRHATAEFYRRAPDRSYRLVAETALLNPVAPVEFFVSNDGRLATLDNWHNLGYGKVVALYDAQAKPLRSYELNDLFPADDIKNFSHSVSSIHWREGPAYIRHDQKTLLVTLKSGSDFLFGLETGAWKYCEYQDKDYWCRNTNQPGQWKTNRELELTR